MDSILCRGDHPPDFQGKEDACLVTADEAKQLVPQLLIAYYQSRLCFVSWHSLLALAVVPGNTNPDSFWDRLP